MRKTERVHGEAADIARAAQLLRRGGLVAFPTETVYGLGARADDADAVRAIFEAKGRPSTNPLIVHVADVEHAAALAADFPAAAARLAEAYWPGPMTLVVRARPGLAAEVTAGGATVGLRVPAHPVARALLHAADVPVAAPSANRSEAISPTTAAHVLKTLDGRIDMVVDGGAATAGIESTIVDVTGDRAVVLRPGALGFDAIARLVDVAPLGHRVEAADARATAPGGFARHYAPRARVTIVAAADVDAEVASLRAAGKIAGAIPLADDPEACARGLYAALHDLDDAGCDVIVVARPPEGDAWAAIRDRLRRAATP